jgi:hypothetical protein
MNEPTLQQIAIPSVSGRVAQVISALQRIELPPSTECEHDDLAAALLTLDAAILDLQTARSRITQIALSRLSEYAGDGDPEELPNSFPCWGSDQNG